ncbi:MAG: hypothetical protein GY716_16275 [bacterium]|nr:hypothetical protein [bacterium]
MKPTRRRAHPLRRMLLVGCLLVAPLAAQQGDPNECDAPGDEPDVIVGDLPDIVRNGSIAGITAFTLATTSCNLGTCWLDWIAEGAAHPVIGQNLYRLHEGRFEHIGQSWLKHGFFAVSDSLCEEGCLATNGEHLGVNCSDPYSAYWNGQQTRLGSKIDVDVAGGTHIHPFTGQGIQGDDIFKRLQVHDYDLDPTLNPHALFFVEGQYVTADDTAAGNGENNASYRAASLSLYTGEYEFGLTSPTVREQPAIRAWVAADPSVLESIVDVPGDGRLFVSSKSWPLDDGYWHYEYAVFNLTSSRAVGRFRVPLPDEATAGAAGFHDVHYHSGDTYDSTAWPAVVSAAGAESASIEWATQSFAQNPSANAVRWGTLYNFRFASNAPPATNVATLGLFAPGTPDEVVALVVAPDVCDADGSCDPGEDCANCPQDCLEQGGLPGTCCGDGTCDVGETACSCEEDCGACEIGCAIDDDCDDGVYCNGGEVCQAGFCAAGPAPCANGGLCDECAASCLDCLVDSQCDDGVFCNGREVCVNNTCLSTHVPCPGEFCDAGSQGCRECYTQTDCDDGVFCNGKEICVEGACEPGEERCPGQSCRESEQLCFSCYVSCNDSQFCNGEEICDEFDCTPGDDPCPDTACDEVADVCIGPVVLQPRVGMPLPGLAPEQLARFEAGKLAFGATFDAAAGLGPAYTATGCAACHSEGITAAQPVIVDRFGALDGCGAPDDMAGTGGPLLQPSGIAPGCGETLPPTAVVSARASGLVVGAGLIEAIGETDLENRALAPPGGISGRGHFVSPLESPGMTQLGRFGWKADHATTLSMAARSAVDHIGLTNRLVPFEDAPNGDPALLAQCDAVADPEDGPDGEGFDFIDRVTDYLRYSAPPPQMPQLGMQGELFFVLNGCTDCHVPSFVIADDPAIEQVFRGRQIRPYSDFLLHDMGPAGESLAAGDAGSREVRTPPLWGLSQRKTLWHDGRISGGTFDERVLAAVLQHDSPGSEAANSAQQFLSLSQTFQDMALDFMASLGRSEFDHDGDNDLDQADHEFVLQCLGGESYGADDPCSIADVDRDGDVDAGELEWFLDAAGGASGAISEGSLRVNRSGPSLDLDWGASCGPDDIDFLIYEGTLGDFGSHLPRLCSTAGAWQATIAAPAGSVYYLVVPSNGSTEGSYGTDGAGSARLPAAAACATQLFLDCP